MKTHLLSEKGDLLRSTSKNAQQGFMDDYAFWVSALIQLYKITGEEAIILEAKKYTEDSFEIFWNAQNKYFTLNQKSAGLFQNTYELSDNVVPASNSVMAHNLWDLSRYFALTDWEELAVQMLNKQIHSIQKQTGAYANYLSLWEKINEDQIELVVCGFSPKEVIAAYQKHLGKFLPAYARENTNLPLCENRYQKGKKLVYFCTNKSCALPSEDLGTEF